MSKLKHTNILFENYSDLSGLSNLALSLIKHNLSEYFDYDNISSNFAGTKARIDFVE